MDLANPKYRILRRVLAVIIAVVLAWLATYVDATEPVKTIDNLLLINAEDILKLLKLLLGTGILMGLDKLRRELPNLQS